MNFKNVMGKDAGGGCGGHQQQQLQNLSALARQSSVYSLTFDEFQSTLGSMGKDFGSMNMDEFLKNIWTAEEGQVMAAAVATDSADLMGLQHQGSLTLPRTLSQKTVDEVWRDLLSAGQGPAAAADAPHQRRQPTLGEMTLEEFLVRAGVVREDMAPPQPEAAAAPSPRAISVAGAADDVLYGGNSCINLGFPQAAKGGGVVVNAPNANSTAANLSMTAAGTRPYSTPMPLGNSVDVGHPQGMRGGELVGVSNVRMNNGLVPGMVSLGAPAGVPVAMDSPANHLLSDGLGKNNGDLTSVSPVPYVFNGGPRGRKSGGTVEKVMERRQRRMIKNRESAARSRARKQAYTMELEAEVAKLKEQNEELMKKQAEMIEMQKNQVLEIINQQRRPKKQCLRRTQTDQVSRLSFLL